jgi:hypothetical protein
MARDDEAGGLRRHHAVGIGLVALIGGCVVGIRSDSAFLGILGAVGAGVVAGLAVLAWAAVAAVVSGFKEGWRETADDDQATSPQAVPLNAHRERERLRVQLAARNADSVESALEAVRELSASEAARSGWLGDIDFTEDIAIIREKFQQAQALRETADTLSLLDRPNADDRRLLEEANDAIADLEAAAAGRVDLIKQCAASARGIDVSLNDERRDADTEAKRAELQATLSAMLFGVEALHKRNTADTAGDAVMARVRAYLEVKEQIRQNPDR